jgi:hypothetical protein
MLDFKKVRNEFDQDVELFGFMLIMDDDSVVAIICHKVICEKEATKYGDKILWLYWNGGYVEISKLKESSVIVMFRWKWVEDFCM